MSDYGEAIGSENYIAECLNSYDTGRTSSRWACGMVRFWTDTAELRSDGRARLDEIHRVVEKYVRDPKRKAELKSELQKKGLW